MVAIIHPKVSIDVRPEHCCNWRCCWGCKSQVDSPRVVESKNATLTSNSSESEIDVTVTAVFHKTHGNRA